MKKLSTPEMAFRNLRSAPFGLQQISEEGDRILCTCQRKSGSHMPFPASRDLLPSPPHRAYIKDHTPKMVKKILATR